MPISKRVFDLAVAGGLLFFLWPVILVCAVLILVIDRQLPFVRVTRMRTPDCTFGMWKLRTMRGRDDGHPTSGAKGHRITKLGSILRKSRLDELPQLWNVLIGDMSIVGPRPLSRSIVSRFSQDYTHILQARPGMTGLATVMLVEEEHRRLAAIRDPLHARRVYEKQIMPQKIMIERVYVASRSLGTDLKILAATLGVILDITLRRKENQRSKSDEIAATLCTLRRQFLPIGGNCQPLLPIYAEMRRTAFSAVTFLTNIWPSGGGSMSGDDHAFGL